MLFSGISFRLMNTEKKEALASLWAFFSEKYSRQDIRVLCFNRTKNYMEYVFGLIDNEDMDWADLQERFPEGIRKQILLPTEGWEKGTEADLDFSYQIQNMEADGQLQVLITKQYPKLCKLQLEDLDAAFGLYQMALGTPGCVWNEDYPTKELLAEDIQAGDFYGIKSPAGEVIAAVSKDRDDQVDELPCWTKEYAPGAEMARLVVHKDWKNQGLARVLHLQMQKELKSRGFRSVHYLVAEDNEPARRSYEALDYVYKGETDMFGHHYFCYEKKLF